MNGLRELNLKNSYDYDVDDILLDFYVSALSVASSYSRLCRFFSSTSLAVASKGISKLIKNNGEIQLVTGAKFSKEDADAIKMVHQKPEELIEKNFLKELNSLENEFVRDHVRALGWMIANKKLHTKIAIVSESEGIPLQYNTVLKKGIFHQKVGILEDIAGNKNSFSGSDNETGLGWQNNIEELKLFRNWVESEKSYFIADNSNSRNIVITKQVEQK
ncbi:MAG: hypothetical protein NUK62_08780 [Tenericutes bacterium]|nr:hypothetical protein [Mycoplasmatota bacterium]